MYILIMIELLPLNITIQYNITINVKTGYIWFEKFVCHWRFWTSHMQRSMPIMGTYMIRSSVNGSFTTRKISHVWNINYKLFLVFKGHFIILAQPDNTIFVRKEHRSNQISIKHVILDKTECPVHNGVLFFVVSKGVHAQK